MTLTAPFCLSSKRALNQRSLGLERKAVVHDPFDSRLCSSEDPQGGFLRGALPP